MSYRYFIIVNNVDNRLTIALNDAPLYDKSQHGDPALFDEIDITAILQPSITNRLRFQGYNGAFTIPGRQNDPNPWHFLYRVVRRYYDAAGTNQPDPVTGHPEDDIIPRLLPNDERGVSNPNIWVIDRTYLIVKAGIFYKEK